MPGAAQLYSIFPPVFDGTAINNIESVTPSAGIKEMSIMPGGAVDQAMVAMAFSDATVKMKSRDLASVLNAVSLVSGKSIGTSAVIQYQKRLNGGTFTGAGTHATLTGSLGMLLVEDIGADQDNADGAEVNLVYYPLSTDGLTKPLSENISANLASAPAVNGLYSLGPVNFEGIVGGLVGVTKVRVKTGIEYKTNRSSGGVFANIGVIVKRAPTIEIEGHNLGLLNSVGFFQSAASAGVTAYFQRVVPGGSRVPYGTASHVAVTMSTGSYVMQEIPVSQRDGDASMRLVCHCTGTLSVNTASAIVIP